jgi:hypothetical protein
MGPLYGGIIIVIEGLPDAAAKESRDRAMIALTSGWTAVLVCVSKKLFRKRSTAATLVA